MVKRAGRVIWLTAVSSNGNAYIENAHIPPCMEVREVVRRLKRMGAECRKHRRADVYTCTLDNVGIVVNPREIKLSIYVDFRTEFLRYSSTEEVPVNDESFERELREITGARVGMKLPAEGSLEFVFDIKDADKALRVAKKLKEKDMWIVLTNMDAELRCMMGDEQVSCWDWIDELKDL